MTGGARRVAYVAMLVAALVCEGFDVTTASFAAPLLAHEFGVTPAGLGPYLTSNAFGMLIGSALIAPLGDRFGRRPMVCTCTSAYGALMLLSTLAQSLAQLTVARFTIGICVGALLPSAIILAGELVSESARLRTSAAVTLGISLGAMLAGAAATAILPNHGWRMFIFVAGIVPLLYSIVLWVALPESPAFDRQAHARTGSPLAPALLFRNGLAGMTVALWLLIILLSMTLYLLSNWTPMLVRQNGFDTRTASLIGTFYYVGGLIGGAICVLLLGRSGWITLAGFMILAAIALFSVSQVGSSVPLLTIGLLASGALVNASQVAFNGIGASAYPLGLRAAGFGCALAVARVGSISGPLIGAALVGKDASHAQHLFAVPVVPLLIAAGLAVWLWNNRRQAAT